MSSKLLLSLVAFALLLVTVLPAQGMGERAKPGKAIEAQAGTELAAVLRSGKPAVVKLGADWCSPCRAMKPVLKELAADLKDRVFVLDLDIDEHRDLARQFRISLIPTTIFYDRRGEPKGKVSGFLSKKELLSKIRELKLEQ